MAKKLFHVTMEFSYYAYAEDAHEAERYADEALSNAGTSGAYAREVQYKDDAIDADWSRDSLVYTDRGEGDTELGKLLDALPERPPRPIRAPAP